MDFNDKTKFKKLTTFSGFNKTGTSPKDLRYFDASDGYYVSCEGEVWSMKSGKPRIMGGLHSGYVGCEILLKDGKSKYALIHRLVAEYWVEGFNPEEGRIIVNHIDENKTNNRPSNLEWCTHKYNSNHGTGIVRQSQAMKETCNNPEYKAKVLQALKDQWNDPEYKDKISKSLKGRWRNVEYKEKMSQATKERWKNSEYREKMSQNWNNPELREKMLPSKRKPVALFQLDGTPYKVFAYRGEASSYAGVHIDTMYTWVKNRKPSKCGKYYWGYYEPEGLDPTM